MSANIADFLAVLQEDARWRLASDPVFIDVPVFLERQGDIENEVINALTVLNEGGTGKIGACAIVLMPDFDNVEPNAPAPIGDVVLSARILESPLYNMGENGTGLSAEKLALRALRVLGFKCERTGTLLTASGDALRPYTEEMASGVIGYDVSVRGQAGMIAGDKVAQPSISGTTLAVSLHCVTSGATLYYTTNGSYPASANTAAQTYSAPFVVDAGTLVRAGAQHPDKVPSEPVSRQF
jgi:hypothetical protein